MVEVLGKHGGVTVTTEATGRFQPFFCRLCTHPIEGEGAEVLKVRYEATVSRINAAGKDLDSRVARASCAPHYREVRRHFVNHK